MRILPGMVHGWLQEDLPYFDLTTHVLGVGARPARMCYYSREAAVVCGTEEAAILVQGAGGQVIEMLDTGSRVEAGQVFFVAEGSFQALNEITKVAQNLFEYASGIATRTQRLVRAARQVNPAINILGTRKVFPGTKALSTKALLAGGAMPHRLGLSETILLFRQHIDFLGGFAALGDAVERIRAQDCERQILVEVENADEAHAVMRLPVQGLQYDKIGPPELQPLVGLVRSENPALIHLAAGGITTENAADYAATGVDGLVTTAVYFGKPVDIGVTFTGDA